MMKRAILVGVLAMLLVGPAMAKDTRFWNLTASTVKSLELAPTGWKMLKRLGKGARQPTVMMFRRDA